MTQDAGNISWRQAAGATLLAGATLALMELATIVRSAGAPAGSPLDLLLVATWLALPYAVALAFAGLAGATIIPALARGCPRAAAYAACAALAALLLWWRGATQLGGAVGVYLLLAMAFVLAGSARAGPDRAALRWAGDSDRHRAALSRAVCWIAGLAVFVVESRNVPGPFGRPAPPPDQWLRLLLAVAAACVTWFALGRISGLSRRWRWPVRAALATAGIWTAFGLLEFGRLLSHAPAVAPMATTGSARADTAAVASDGAAGVSSNRPNVILISVDTLRADHLCSYGHQPCITPNMDKLAAAGVRFVDTASTSSFTTPSHASMMTGLLPSAHGAQYQRTNPNGFVISPIRSDCPTLAEMLLAQGYQTTAFVSSPMVGHQFGFARGFQLFDDRYDRLDSARAQLFALSAPFGGLMRIGLFTRADRDRERTADEINAEVAAWVDSRGKSRQPVFLFVHYYDPHAPYAPPAEFDLREDPGRPRVDHDLDRLIRGDYTLTRRALTDTLALYDGEIKYVDARLGGLMQILGDAGLLRDSLLILTSDHGESFGEHGHWGHNMFLYEELLRVPFIMKLPDGRAAGTAVSGVVAQPSDIVPTVLSVVGLSRPDGLQGKDLTPFIVGARLAPASPPRDPEPATPALAELERNVGWAQRWGARFDRDLTALRAGRWKYIQSSAGQEELYDVVGDPLEARDLSAQRADVLGRMRNLLDAWRRSPLGRRDRDSAEPLDQGAVETLRSLGYVQ